MTTYSSDLEDRRAPRRRPGRRGAARPPPPPRARRRWRGRSRAPPCRLFTSARGTITGCRRRSRRLAVHEPAGERRRAAEVEALRRSRRRGGARSFERLLVADHLGDRALAEAAGDAHDRLDHELVGAVGDAAADELAVDLQVVERQVLEVVEARRRRRRSRRARSGSRARRGGSANSCARGMLADRGRLGDLEDDLRGVDLVPCAARPRSAPAGPGRRSSGRRC